MPDNINNPLTNFDPANRSEWSCIYKNMYGEELDIHRIVESISIYESIFHETIFGHILLNDNIGFAERQGIVGQGLESFTISVHSRKGIETSSNFEKTFRINSYHDADYKGDGKKGVTAIMDIVSPMLMKNNKTKISRSFNSMTASEIVDYVAYEIMDFGDGLWDNLQTNVESINVKNIVVPNWSPFKLMNFLCKNSVSTENSSNYMFFENNTGFHFTTIDELKSKDVSVNIKISQVQKDSLVTQTDGGITSVSNVAEKYQETKRFNHSESMINGLYGGKLFTHNILKKEYNTYEAMYDSDEFEMGWAGLDGAGQIGKKSDSHLGFMPDEYIYNIHDKKDKSHFIHRDMKMAELRTNIVKFNIPGNSSIWAGDIINIDKESQLNEAGEELDQLMSGRWLVTAIHHQIAGDGYFMTLECMKDSFENKPE